MPISKRYQPIGSIISNPVRALDVIYRNLTGQLLLVIATTTHTVPANGDIATVIGQVDTVTPPGVVACSMEIAMTVGSLNATLIATFVVPIGYYYRLVSTTVGTGAVGLVTWTEVQLISPQSAGF